MSKYYISNNIRFIQGLGNLMDNPTSATHMQHNDAQRYISMHPDHMMVRVGKKRRYIISTNQKYVGKNGEIVNNMSSAINFGSQDEAFSYIDNNSEICAKLGDAFVIDENFKKIHREKTVKPQQPKKSANENSAQRIIFSKQTRQTVLTNYNYTCPICGKTLSAGDVTIDHIVPLSRGGTNSLDNLRPVHSMCNHMKNNCTDDEFYGGVADIACNYLYNSPQSEMAMRIIRSMVRGTIQNKPDYFGANNIRGV